MPSRDEMILAVFGVVYLGMLLGGLPFMRIDRTGVALLGAIALIAGEAITMDEASRAVHMPTLSLLFSFMVVSAQLRLGGFYAWVVDRLGALNTSAPRLLAMLIAIVAVLSAVFSNDVVCLAVAPVLIELARARRLNPVPFLLALAAAANIGSAATLIGNPQNMLIGETLQLDFSAYLIEAALPVLAGLVLVWWLLHRAFRNRWAVGNGEHSGGEPEAYQGHHPFDLWQTAKGLAVAGGLFAAFLFTQWPRELLALGAAGFLLLSRKLHSRHMLGQVDWQVLLLFMGLFVVNHTLETTGLPERAVQALADAGIDLRRPMILFVVTFLLSNLVSNVPAVMLLLPVSGPGDGALLALSSTFAGNLFLAGSIANLIVVETAARYRISVGWLDHARIGVPLTLLSLAVAAGFLVAGG